MNVFIAADMEGVAGLVQWDNDDVPLQKRLMTEEVNAAARGAFSAGADQVVAGNSHASMRFVLPELLDDRVTVVSGQPKPMSHMAGVDESVDLALFVGYHAMAGATRGVMAHTFSTAVFRLAFNGIEVGEIGTDAALCGAFGVPVGLVAGDRAACDEAHALLPNVRTVAVKEGISRFCARCEPLARAHKRIEQAAAEAVREPDAFKPFVIEGPVTVEVTLVDPADIDVLECIHFVRRIDGRTVQFEAPDLVKAFNLQHILRAAATTIR